MQAPRIRLGIVGCGRVTETCHLPALAGLGQLIDVTALADVDEHRRRRVAGMFDIERTFAGVEQMLGDSAAIDALAVCTPAEHHADAVVAALDMGKHVLVEKPLALTLDDADRIVAAATAAAARSGRKVMVGLQPAPSPPGGQGEAHDRRRRSARSISCGRCGPAASAGG